MIDLNSKHSTYWFDVMFVVASPIIAVAGGHGALFVTNQSSRGPAALARFPGLQQP